MRGLLDFLINSKHWFVFLILEGFSLIVLFSFNGYQRSVYFTTANSVVGSVYSFTSGISSYLDLQSINEDLEKENEKLRLQLISMQEKMQESTGDSIELASLPPIYEFTSAKVVNATIHRTNNLITINKGEVDGIRPEMGVVCSKGVVGVVYLTSAHYSIVMPLLNVNSKLSCRLRNSNYFGTLAWNHVRPDVTYLSGIPRHAKVKKQEIVETNGYSDIFPPGIPVGYVLGISDSSDGMSYLLRVGLFTNFSTLRDVSIITNYSKPELKELEQKADSLNPETTEHTESI